MRTAEQILEEIKTKHNIGIAWQISKPFILEAIEMAQLESIDEIVKACADRATAYTLNGDEPVAYKSSILLVAEQLKSKL